MQPSFNVLVDLTGVLAIHAVSRSHLLLRVSLPVAAAILLLAVALVNLQPPCVDWPYRLDPAGVPGHSAPLLC